MRIDEQTVATWFNYVRHLTMQRDYAALHRYSECFWESQLLSKSVIIDLLPSLPDRDSVDSVVVFGGWNGLLAQIIDDSILVNTIYSVDIDHTCEKVINQFFQRNSIIPVSCDMAEYHYIVNPDFVINTSTEHVSQEVYDKWWNNIPLNTKYIIQGNNLEIPEHVRIASDMEDFKLKNRCTKISDQIVTTCPGPNGDFERYTVLGIKT